MVNHQIPMREREETKQKPSDSYGEKVRQLVENYQVPMEKKENPW